MHSTPPTAQSREPECFTASPRMPSDFQDHWHTLNLPQQRALLDGLIDSVVVAPARKGGNRVDPSRVTISWAT